MSRFPDRWKAIQKKVGADPDGNPDGEDTIGHIEKALGIIPMAEPITIPGDIDERSARNIATLLPEVQPLARVLVLSAAKAGITIKVISGTRTYDEQNALYAQGRNKPGKVVTNARGGYSNHNFGLAFDIGVFEGNRYIEESQKYKEVGKIGKAIGFDWGGDWSTIKDEPHFELRPAWAKGESESSMLAELRRRQASGQKVFV